MVVFGQHGFIKARSTLSQQQLPTFLIGIHKCGKTKVHASESGIHVIMFHRIKAIGRENRQVTLGSTQTNTHFRSRQAFNVSFKDKFVGYIVRLFIPFIQNNDITQSKIR